MVSMKGLAFTHLLTFLAGVAVGKAIDADELQAYRSSHEEDTWSRIRRRIKSLLAGTVILSLLVKTGSWALSGDRNDASQARVGKESKSS
mmetsp:Transcript_7724/g.16531  ORF Transcript_7724/g.16531 Transcript_7724/m.16531 type:complete len:90 (+) Transcript_7724:110-379(+)